MKTNMPFLHLVGCLIIIGTLERGGFVKGNDCDDPEEIQDAERRLTANVVNVVNVDADNLICDLKIRDRWYKAGDNIDMPTTAPQIGACGTKYPIWVNGTIPLNDTSVHHLVGGLLLKEGSTCAMQFTIQVKNCGNYRLYRFPPVSFCPMGYCFQEPEPGDMGQTEDGDNGDEGDDEAEPSSEPEHGDMGLTEDGDEDDEENGDGEKVEDGGDDDGAESIHYHWAYISILFLASVIAVRL